MRTCESNLSGSKPSSAMRTNAGQAPCTALPNFHDSIRHNRATATAPHSGLNLPPSCQSHRANSLSSSPIAFAPRAPSRPCDGRLHSPHCLLPGPEDRSCCCECCFCYATKFATSFLPPFRSCTLISSVDRPPGSRRATIDLRINPSTPKSKPTC